ncbi:efflux RND transporter permease subunit [Fulvivirgaceae bacterium BMA12]|uniref:Efflux RND transporter permease subunit n=1 Tax=Agaribacillus aureus TaxID=3051825 RepID=A0ABT8LBJ9_9BACT|nr:efflux RND transporter permease subunit [Fulvivirgaceae bacterium BMA12]
MKLTKLAIERPITTAMLFLALVLFGYMTYTKLAVNLFPDLKIPAVVINTYHVGATPEEVEKEITDKIEKEIATLSGLKSLKSFSMPESSLITIEFNNGIEPDKALNEVKTKLDLVTPYLPKEAERPLVFKYKLSDIPVIDLVVSSDKLSGSELYDYVDRVIKAKLSRLEGVSKIDLYGGEEREIKVLVNKKAMYDIGMNVQEVSQYLKAVNTKTSGGSYIHKDRVSSVEVGKNYKSVTDVENTYLPTPFGIRKMTEFATVKDSTKTVKGKAIFYDMKHGKRYENIVSVGIMKTADANAVKVARDAKILVAELQQELPEGVSVSIPFDTSEYVESAVDDALTNIILGIIITGIILFFFLNDIRTTLIVSISIPVSLMGTFIAMRVFNGSLNMMTLMSFSVAIGALVSNSIVVIENIIRLRNTGMDIKEAAVQGTQEVMMAVIASTGTNLVVFLPIASMTSSTGAFFKEYALTISAATIFSLIVSFMLTPMLASILLKKERKPNKLAQLSMRFFDWLEGVYERSLIKLLSKKWKPLALFSVMFMLFIGTTSLLPYIGFEFEPQEDNGDVFIEMEMPSGTAVDKSERIIKQVEQEIERFEGVNSVLTIIGQKNSSTTGENFANTKLKLVKKEYRPFSNAEFSQQLEEKLENIPDLKASVSTVSADDGAPIQFMLKSDNQDDLQEASAIVLDKLAEVEGLLNYESSLRKGNPLIHFKPNNRLLAELNLTSLEVAMAVRNAINGAKATVLKENGKEYDITVSYPNNAVNSVEKIEQLPIFTPQGMYTIGQLAKVFYEESPSQIQHDNKVKTVDISANLAPGALQGDVQNSIHTLMTEMVELPPSVKFSWTGSIKELNEATNDMMLTFGIALLLMYMLLASLVESFWQPIVIFTTVPMAMIGVFLFMYFFGSTMNVMSLMAIITLLGLVVNDDILIHDYTDHLMKEKKMDLYNATVTAGKTKMKTVIMTTVAIIFGMLPNALGIGDAGAELRSPMAIVTIGGMITSTILTLYLIPSIFYVIKTSFKKKKVAISS